MQKQRGRPVRSQIRQNIVEILYYMKRAYGYSIAQVYNEIFPEVPIRSIYYHLKKGVETEEFEIEKIVEEKGIFSWGTKVEKTYYILGESSQVKGDDQVSDYFKTLRRVLRNLRK